MFGLELGEVQSMTLITHRYSISDYTVATVLKKAGKALDPSYRTLPKHIGIDELESMEECSRIDVMYLNRCP
ncbi:hypothetical protein ACTQ45_06140 [Fundicoccus sp. Sow4_D5]|uniref:hypothetical protein n=1 Tax=Fundicoccus sp. Sow4_D5 TaxID=3438782 RepID=UPI003F9243B5